MIVVPGKFVYSHLPKTGGSFVAKVLRKHFETREIGWQHTDAKDYKERKLPVVVSIRDPADWYVSRFYYQWWKGLPDKLPGVASLPGFPDITFEQYYGVDHEDARNGRSHGKLSRYVARKWAYNPVPIMDAEDAEESAKAYYNLAVPKFYLNTKFMSSHLALLLERFGVDQSICDEVRASKPVKPPSSKGNDGLARQGRTVEETASPEVLEQIRYNDRMIYSLFDWGDENTLASIKPSITH